MSDSKVIDNVNHPAHCTDGKIEVIDFIDDKKLGFCLGNAVKYIARAGKKDNLLEDLKKARWYLDHEIHKLEDSLQDAGILDEIVIKKAYELYPVKPAAFNNSVFDANDLKRNEFIVARTK